MSEERDGSIRARGWQDVARAGSCMADGPAGGLCLARKVFVAQLAPRGGLELRLCARHLEELTTLARRAH